MTTAQFTKRLSMFAIICYSVAAGVCGCDDVSGIFGDDPTEGRIKNDTAYYARLNIISHKIMDLPPGNTVKEAALQADRSYQIDITILDETGAAISTIPTYSLYIDDDADDQKLDGARCSWFLRIYGTSEPFGVDSGS